MNTTFMYQGCEVYLKFGQYENGAIAVRLFVADTGEPYDTITVNLGSDHLPAPNEIIIQMKEFATDNIVEVLKANKIIAEEEGIELRFGYKNKCVAFMQELTDEAYDQFVKDCG